MKASQYRLCGAYRRDEASSSCCTSSRALQGDSVVRANDAAQDGAQRLYHRPTRNTNGKRAAALPQEAKGNHGWEHTHCLAAQLSWWRASRAKTTAPRSAA